MKSVIYRLQFIISHNQTNIGWRQNFDLKQINWLVWHISTCSKAGEEGAVDNEEESIRREVWQEVPAGTGHRPQLEVLCLQDKAQLPPLARQSRHLQPWLALQLCCISETLDSLKPKFFVFGEQPMVRSLIRITKTYRRVDLLWVMNTQYNIQVV